MGHMGVPPKFLETEYGIPREIAFYTVQTQRGV